MHTAARMRVLASCVHSYLHGSVCLHIVALIHACRCADAKLGVGGYGQPRALGRSAGGRDPGDQGAEPGLRDKKGARRAEASERLVRHQGTGLHAPRASGNSPVDERSGDLFSRFARVPGLSPPPSPAKQPSAHGQGRFREARQGRHAGRGAQECGRRQQRLGAR
jgi:hypothetical protein